MAITLSTGDIRKMSLNSLIMSCLIIASICSAQTYSNQDPYGSYGDVKHDLILSSSTECARECFENDPPKTCYYHLTLELYTVAGEACTLCTPNNTNSLTGGCQCVLADGFERTALTANRMLPGPSIEVCLGDKVVIDVKNLMEGMETAIHWHGFFQRGTQYYDGVPFLTQCPIGQGNTFRYQFMADNDGTHFWHSHSGLQKLDGLFGSLIVRKPHSQDPNNLMYDYDRSEHVIILSDWMHELSTERFPGRQSREPGQIPDSVLINGRGQHKDPTTGNSTNTILTVFTISSNYKYRFRMVNAFCTVCPAELRFQGHSMTLIATDGEPVYPMVVDTLISFAGERYDFVLNGHEKQGAYWIHLRGLGECANNKVDQLAILRYEGGPLEPESKKPTYDETFPNGVVFNAENGTCNKSDSDNVCITDLKSAKLIDSRLLADTPDIKLYLPFHFYTYSPSELFRANQYDPFLVGGNTSSSVLSLINNISFVSPPSPPMSQIDDISPQQFCNSENRPVDCGLHCMCTHKIDIPLNAVVEIVLVDEVGSPDLIHPFHLHGYAFTVLAMGRSPSKVHKKISTAQVRLLDSLGLVTRIVEQPPSKDTIPVPDNGYVVFRFIADNPGYWLMHCHFLYHITIGMDMILKVGNHTDFPPVPKNFPVCGDYLPPITSPTNYQVFNWK